MFPKPAEGDIYYNTITKNLRIFLDGSWRDVVPAPEPPEPLSIDDLTDVRTAVDPDVPWESPAGNLLGWNAVGRRWQPVQGSRGLARGTFRSVSVPQSSVATLDVGHGGPALVNVTTPDNYTLELQLEGYWTATSRLEGFAETHSGTPRALGTIMVTTPQAVKKNYRASIGFAESYLTVSATFYATAKSRVTFDAYSNVGVSNIRGDFVVKYLGES